MTIRLEMAMAYIDQQEVIDVLRSIDDLALVERLERCMTAHQQRHNGSGWPFSCRSVACIWCRRSMIRGWWNGMCHWAAEATMSSLLIIPIDCSPGCPMLCVGCDVGCVMCAIVQRGAGGGGVA